MAYIRKTKDEFQLLCNCGYGWGLLVSDDTLEKAEARKKEYSEIITDYDFKIVKKRVPIQQ